MEYLQQCAVSAQRTASDRTHSVVVPQSQPASTLVHLNDDIGIAGEIPQVDTCDECVQLSAEATCKGGLPTPSNRIARARTHLNAESKLKLHVGLERLLRSRPVSPQQFHQAQQEHA